MVNKFCFGKTKYCNINFAKFYPTGRYHTGSAVFQKDTTQNFYSLQVEFDCHIPNFFAASTIQTSESYAYKAATSRQLKLRCFLRTPDVGNGEWRGVSNNWFRDYIFNGRSEVAAHQLLDIVFTGISEGLFGLFGGRISDLDTRHTDVKLTVPNGTYHSDITWNIDSYSSVDFVRNDYLYVTASPNTVGNIVSTIGTNVFRRSNNELYGSYSQSFELSLDQLLIKNQLLVMGAI